MNEPLDQSNLVNFEQVGARLRAYRIGSGLRSEQIADLLGISRAAVYRMEKGEIVKIETLTRVAEVLNTSLHSLLGLGTEYYRSAVAYIERMRQLEEGTTHILAHFDPISYFLTSESYDGYLEQMLLESPDGHDAQSIRALVDLLRERKRIYAAKPIPIRTIIGLRELEQFVHFGLVGRIDLPPATRMERSLAARMEVERIARLMEEQQPGVEIGLVQKSMPTSTFQVFSRPAGACLAISPYRFREFPNISSGIASVTFAAEAVELYTEMMDNLWASAHLGRAGADLLRAMLQRV